jgi:hypothetical protein
MKLAFTFPIALVVIAAGCGNPVVDARIAALGPEDPAVPESDIHRPGQPCLLCHGPYKGADPEMVVAGTVYAYAFTTSDKNEEPIPVEGATVELFDAYGKTAIDPTTNEPFKIETNCAGNFYVTKAQWNPGFPLNVAIYCPVGMDEPQRVPMASRISRDGSCAGCHDGNPNFAAQPEGGKPGPNQGTPGWIYCSQPGAGAPKFEKPSSCSPKVQ